MLNSSNYVIQSHCLDDLKYYLESLSCSKVVIITHPQLWAMYEQKITEQFFKLSWSFSVLLIPEGETSKSLKQTTRCWRHFIKHQLDRYSLVIALGGGVICDLAGFVASCYMRGIDTIYLPTTLLAMVDASIGGKTGINTSKSKNIIGSFHLPKKILIDPFTLKTLSKKHYQAGFAEIVKYGMIASHSLFELLENSWSLIEQRDEELLEIIIQQSCAIKKKYVEADFKDLGIRAQLNYGHTFGHVIEMMSRYQYLHGEAVSIGMSCAAYLSCQMGLTTQETMQRQDALCQQAQLPIHLPHFPLTRFTYLMAKDKKGRNGSINLILPEKVGKVTQIFDVDPHLIKNTLSTKMAKQ
ncbi:3-dehydroquinate synthase [Candidatus Protochlamydia sp. R18]|uniref:3-dehydroquinate synthase n=1 Tax=Candidatus Protochlamydia sp. R18 TaxID=1353977 RepID=UPI0005A71CF0|nr:3-dehydroquinate synthase [Candidatus Protochlamydia sp. R18]